MDKALRPERFEGNANTSTSAKEFAHWLKTFEYYLDVLPQETLNKLRLLTNFVAPSVYEYFSECTEYAAAIEALKKIYVKPTNEVFARHQLSTRKQNPGETLDEFLQALKTLSKDCNFVAVSADKNKSDAIRDAFINGIQSSAIRQRLLENQTLELNTMFDQARSLDSAQKNVESYRNQTPPPFNAAISQDDSQLLAAAPMLQHSNNITTSDPSKCWNCGNNRHPRSSCPARNAECNRCGKKGHLPNYCRSNNNNNNNNNNNSNNNNNNNNINNNNRQQTGGRRFNNNSSNNNNNNNTPFVGTLRDWIYYLLFQH